MYWQPLYLDVINKSYEHNGIVLIICPFIQLTAIKLIISKLENCKDLKIITRWKEEDVLSGVSDVNIYTYLKDKNVKLYINKDLHIKLIIFQTNQAFLMTGNITEQGLGINIKKNVEGGILTDLNINDWSNIFNIITNSIEIDDDIYNKYLAYIENNKNLLDKKLPSIDISNPYDKAYSIFSLPITKSPDFLYTLYKTSERIKNNEHYRKLLHDILLYNIDFGLKKKLFFKKLSYSFIQHPFIKDLLKYIKSRKKKIRFGSLKKWLQVNCSNKPVPYMYELTKNAQVLYNWLPFFFPKNIKITRPSHSQLIEWLD